MGALGGGMMEGGTNCSTGSTPTSGEGEREQLEHRALAGVPTSLLRGRGTPKVIAEAVANRREFCLYGAPTGRELAPGPFSYLNGQVTRPGGIRVQVIATLPMPLGAGDVLAQQWADRDAVGKRIAAALNAVEGIPTLELASGALLAVVKRAMELVITLDVDHHYDASALAEALDVLYQLGSEAAGLPEGITTGLPHVDQQAGNSCAPK